MTPVHTEPEATVTTDRDPIDETVRWNPRCNRARTEYGAVVLDGVRGRYYQLNPTAAAVVDELVAGRSVGETARVLHERFGVDRHAAQRDVASLVEDLRSRGMVM